MFDAFVSIHSYAADRAFHNTGQQMYFCILAPVDAFVFFRLRQQLDLRLVPEFFRHDSLMQAVHQQIIVLLHQPVIISCAMYLLRPASAIGDFPAVYRIFQNPADQRRIE